MPRVRTPEERTRDVERAFAKLYQLNENPAVPTGDVIRVARDLYTVLMKYGEMEGYPAVEYFTKAAAVAKDFLCREDQWQAATNVKDHLLKQADAQPRDNLVGAYNLYLDAAVCIVENRLNPYDYTYARLMLDPIMFHLGGAATLVQDIRVHRLPGIRDYGMAATPDGMRRALQRLRERQKELGIAVQRSE
jgi:hypothetical protein